jgi:hypothetical protein
MPEGRTWAPSADGCVILQRGDRQKKCYISLQFYPVDENFAMFKKGWLARDAGKTRKIMCRGDASTEGFRSSKMESVEVACEIPAPALVVPRACQAI